MIFYVTKYFCITFLLESPQFGFAPWKPESKSGIVPLSEEETTRRSQRMT